MRYSRSVALQLLHGIAAGAAVSCILLLPFSRVILLVLGLIPAASLFAFFWRGHSTAVVEKSASAAAWIGSWIAWGVLCTKPLDPFFAGFGTALAVSLGVTASKAQRNWSWRVLSLVWGTVSSGVLLALGYSHNELWLFYVGWGLLLLVLAILPLVFRLPFRLVQLLLGLLLFLLVLPLIDWVLQPRSDAAHDLRKRLFSFSAASKDPVSFQRWWDYYRQEWDKMGSEIFKPDSTGKFPLRLRENARGELAESQIRINKHGFRGEDFEVEKGSVFRIVAIGESTTFGCTLAAGDRPWPELLEESINRQLHPMRPVQVINAGVPAYTLTHNVERLWQEILPLKPDLVVSYHGFNGFRMLDEVLPPVHGRRPPAYRKRPIKLLGDVEHRFRLRRWENSRAPTSKSVAPKEPMHTAYAEAYRQLIDTCRTNEIRLALATFSMAVNRESPREVVEFYRLGFPSVYAQIAANEAHSSIVRTLARKHPDVILIDTEPVLDGQHEFFIDLIHLTQEGRNKMAEAILQKLRPYIPKE